MAKAEFGRSWWSQRFVGAIERFTDSGRLSRGRSYARGNKVKSFDINAGTVTAQVRGSVNPYFGVYKEPLYRTTIEFTPISEPQWNAAIAFIASKSGFLSKLMMNEIPENIEEPFATLGIHLLPQTRKELNTNCSCPDYSNPCKHIAGVYYLLGAALDRDPYLLFELRGMSRDRFQKALAETPLGKALAQELNSAEIVPQPIESYYPRPALVPVGESDLKTFWMGNKRLPKDLPLPVPSLVSGVLVKQQGDFPAFWEGDSSFLETMEEIYDRVKTKNQSVL
ncbi:MAG: hypothetical protein HC771_22845 [Synechococcales cyanobacterium CRU_2_2]|nr:hypothetical protein [Synechococcales cyanobacterium CRU_2_2]